MGAFMTGKLGELKLDSRWALARACDGVRNRVHLALEPLEPRALLAAGPLGPEFLVNAAAGEAWEPAIAMDRDGDFVVAWVSRDSQKGTDAICARRFDSSGSPLGPDLPISTQSTHPANEPHLEHVAVVMDAQHNFVVTWASQTDRQSGDDIYARRYDAKGQTLGPAFRVNTITDGQQQLPTIAMNPGGSFAIAWQSEDSHGDTDIYARRFGTSGLPVGGEFRVNAYTSGDQVDPAIAMDATGDFLLAWASNGQDGDGTGIYARSYDAAGTAKANEFRVNTTTRGSQACPAVALADNGSFVVAWEGWGATDDSGVYAQRFNAQGLPAGGETRVSTYSESFQQKPAIAMDAAGNCIVTWHSRNQDGSGDGVYVQRYGASGTAQGGESRVNTYTRNDQAHAAVAMDANGNAAVVWESVWQDGAISSIRAQRFATSASSASISGRVWNDANANSIQDAEELGIDAVAVTLFTSTGLPIASTTTSAEGTYQFADLLPGQSYYLEVARRQDLVLVLANAGNDDALDSDINPATARSETITLPPDQNHVTLDAGLTPKTTIRGKIYQDSNSNGTRDEGEPTLAG
ncbi:MAG: SdrD B-like domain-containing protein, partial [Bacillota bacterium]